MRRHISDHGILSVVNMPSEAAAFLTTTEPCLVVIISGGGEPHFREAQNETVTCSMFHGFCR